MRKSRLFSAVFSYAIILSSFQSIAVDKSWVCDSENWGRNDCWNPVGQPNTGDNVYLIQSGSTDRIVTYDETLTPTPELNSLRIDATGSGTMTLLQEQGSLDAADIFIGYDGNGIYTQLGGVNDMSSQENIYLGYNSTATGIYNLYDGYVGNIFPIYDAYVGYNGAGIFNQYGGIHSVSDLQLGFNNNANGTYNLYDGHLDSRSTRLGYNGGAATFNQGGGTLYVDAGFYIGENSVYNISSGSITLDGNSGFHLYGTFNQTGGDVVVPAGTEKPTVLYGEYNLIAGSLTTFAVPGIDGTFNQSGGVYKAYSGIEVGGTYNLTGGSIDAGKIDVKSGGTFNVDGGTLDTETFINGGTLTIDGGAFSTGTLVNNGGFAFNSGTFNLTNDNLVIGAGGLFGSSTQFNNSQTVNITNVTTINSGSVLSLNNSAFSSGTTNNNGQINLGGVITNLGGGTVNNVGRITGSGQVSATLNNMSSGEVRAVTGGAIVFSGTGNTNNGEINLLGGGVEFSNGVTNSATGFIGGRGSLISNNVITNEGVMAFSGGFTDVIGDVSNVAGGRIVVSGGSTTTFFDDVTHNGTEIRVSAGNQAVYLGSVSGAGSFTGTGTNFFEGDLRPGNSPSKVDFEGDVVFGLGNLLAIEIGGLLPGDEYDWINVDGSATLGGTLDVGLFDLGTGLFEPSLGNSFDILTAETIDGEFDLLTLALLGDGLKWDVSYLADAIGTTDIVRLSVSQVPIPPAIWLFGSGLIGLIGIARRKKS